LSDSELVVAYDLLEAGYELFWMPAIGLIFVALGILEIRYAKFFSQFISGSWSVRACRIFGWITLCFAVAWTTLTFTATFGPYHILRSDYLAKNYKIAEGSLIKLAASKSSQKTYRNYSVADQRISFSADSTVTGWGPDFILRNMDAGSHVRIAFKNQSIFRIEVERAALTALQAR